MDNKLERIHIVFLEWDFEIEDWVYDYDVITDLLMRSQNEDDNPSRVVGVGI